MAVDSAKLALYEGIRESDLVDENIDERILRLLGLQDIFDIDYGTYISLLREKLAESRLVDKKISTEENMILTDEFKRVKGKVGRFKIKKKKISAENIGATGPIRVSKEKFFLAGKAVIPEVKEPAIGKNLKTSLEDMASTLDDILYRLLVQNKYAKSSAESERKNQENISRGKKESELEKPVQKMVSLATKMLAPVQNILDSIFKFIFFTLLGRAFVKLTKWFSDPKNKEKIETLKKFLKDWWPSIFGAFLLFATPFGKFVRSTIATLAKFTPRLLSLIKANPLSSLVITTSVAGTVARTKEREKLKPFVEDQKKKISEEEKNSNLPWYKKFGNFFAKQELTTGQNQQSLVAPVPGAMYSNGGVMSPLEFGGLVTDSTGTRVSGAGQDTQALPIEGGGAGILKKGEIVMNTDAVNAIGRDRLLSWNRIFGGSNANKPVLINNALEAHRNGGVIGSSSAPNIGMGFLNKSFATLPSSGTRSKSQQPMGSSVLNQLGRFLPGTGSVISPRHTEMGIQNKLLGIPLNRSVVDQRGGHRLSPKSVQRYNQNPNAPSTIRQWSPFDSTQVSVPKPKPTSNSTIIRDSFRNFGANVQTIKDAAKRQEKVMRELGYEPDGYVNLRGQPINIGPQSKLTLPGPPVRGATNVSVIQLPDVVRNTGSIAYTRGSTTVPNIPDQYSVNKKINKSIYGIA